MVNLNTPHRRLNLLTGEWLLVSPQRAERPWLGRIEKIPSEILLPYDPTCYLCPGNSRAGGKRNPIYTNTFVFDNDFPALLKPEELEELSQNLSLQTDLGIDLFQVRAEAGICRVVCFSPRHDLTLPELLQSDIETVIHTWTNETRDLGSKDYINYVQIFENKGSLMGCSNPHPHSQIWASSLIPNEAEKEIAAQKRYLKEKGSCLLCDYLASETKLGIRTVAQNDQFIALIPFWAVWPFEMIVIPKRHTQSLLDLSSIESAGLAEILREVTIRYDNLFEISFPYSMGFHQAPTDGEVHESWHLHAHFYPPLLRSATVRKFMVGYEMLAMPQRDLTSETAAERLRLLSRIHYRTK